MSQWAEFLRKLNPEGTRALSAVWRLSDGTCLQKEIPAARQVLEETLAADSTFQNKLYEIVELEFSADLDEIEQAARTSGLIYRRKPDCILVRSPYTC